MMIWRDLNLTKQNKGVCRHTMALPFYIKKYYLKAKEEELRKLKYLFHHAKIY